MQRELNIDILKGIGIISVIIGHLTTIWYLRGIIYSFHMPLFFLASGYFFKYKKNKDLISKLAYKLLKPYVIFAFITLLISYVPNIPNEDKHYYEYFKMIIFADGYYNKTNIWGEGIPPIGILWFLPALFWCRIIHNNIQEYKYKFYIAVFISITSVYLGKNIINIPFGILEGSQAVIFQTAGSIYSNSLKLKSLSHNKLIIISFFFIWIIIAHNNYMSMADFSYSNWPLNIIAAFLGNLCIYNCILSLNKSQYKFINRLKNIFIWFGRNSLYIFCIHSIVMTIQCHIIIIQPNNFTWIIVVIIHLIIATVLTLIYNCYKNGKVNKCNNPYL